MKRSLIIALVLLGVLLVVTACSGSSEESADAEHAEEHVEDEHGEDEHAVDEHMDEGMDMDMDMDHAHVEAPDEFAGLSNPFAGDTDAIDAGQEIFITNCATCHGATGAGDGEAAAGLDPKPANLGDADMMSTLTDGYLFWRVTKGGTIEPFNSAMPSWEQGLTEDQRWQVISFVRTLSEQ